MNIDERLERLAVRQAALLRSIELIVLMVRETAAALKEDSVSNHKLAEVRSLDAEALHTLVLIAEDHDGGSAISSA